MADETVRLKIIVDEDTKGAKRAKDAVDDVTDSTEKLGDQFKESAKEAKSFDERLKDLTRQRAEYAKKYLDTEDKAHLRRYSAISREIGLLTKLKQVSESIKEDDDKGFVPTTLLALRGMNIPTPAALAVVAAPIALNLAAAIGAAAEGAIGAGGVVAGIAGGIFAASKSPQVRQAAQGFGAQLSAEFFSAGQSFVGPTQDALHILAADIKSIHLGETFERAAPAVTILAHGIGDLVKGLMPGFNRLLDKSVPITNALAEGLGGTGEALSSLLTDVAESKGTIEGLVFLLDSLNGTVEFLGGTLKFLGDGFHQSNVWGAELSGVLEDLVDGVPLLGSYTKWANDHFEELSGTGEAATEVMWRYGDGVKAATKDTDGLIGATDDATEAIDGLAGRMELFSAQLDADEAARNYEQAIDDLTAAVEENGTSLDITTEKGRNVSRAYDDAVQAAIRHRDANIKNGMSIDDANAKYEAEIKKLERLAVQLGISKAAVDKLAGRYDLEIVTKYTTIGHPRSNPGNGEVDVANWNVSTSGGITHSATRRAGGGPAYAGRPYIVGDGGRPELFVPETNGVILPRVPSMAPSAVAPRPLVIDGGGWGQMAFDWLVREVQNRGGTLAVLGIRS